MASNEELSEQLTLTSKLAAAQERMAAAAEKLEGSYESQLESVTKLADAFTKINSQNAVKDIQSINKVMQEMHDKIEKTGKSTKTVFEKFGKTLLDTGKTLENKFPKSLTIGTAAIMGFEQGIRNIVSLGKGIVGFTTSFIDGAVGIAASIVAIPFKIFEGLVDMAAKSAGGSNELAEAIENLRKQFGAMNGPTNKAIIDTSKSLTGFAATGLSAWRVFGNMAERLNYIRELVTTMGTSFNLLRKEMEDNGGAILAYQKGLGLTGESLKAITQKSDMMGVKTGSTLKDMTKYSYALGKALNLDAKVISREMGEAMKDMAHFGTTSTKSLGESVAFAHKFGLELKDITGTLDTFDSFDDAAEHASNLSQAFGVNIDSYKMMKASAEGDVAGATEILRKAFREQGIDASKFNNVQKALIKENTGLDDSALLSVFSLKKQGTSLKDVQKAGDNAQKSTMTQAQAMGQLSDAIERMTKAGQGLEGGFWTMFLKGIMRGIMSSKEFYGLMRNIQLALRQTFMIGVQLGRQLIKIVPGLADIGAGLKALFEPKKFAGMFRSISSAVEKFFGKPGQPETGSIPMLVDNLRAAVENFFSSQSPAGRKLLNGVKSFLTAFSGYAVSAIKFMGEKIADGAKMLIELIKDPSKLNVSGVSGGVSGGLGFLWGVIKPIIDALKNAWTIFKDPLAELLGVVGNGLLDLIETQLLPMIGPKAWAIIAAVLFGPALTSALLTALTTSIVKGVGGFMMSTGKKLLGNALQNAVVGSTEKLAEGAAAAALKKSTQAVLEEGASSGASAAGPAVSAGIWSKLIPFLTTIPSAAAAGGAAGVGAVLAAVAAAGVAVFSAWDAGKLHEELGDKLAKIQRESLDNLGKNAGPEAKVRALESIDAQLKASEDALKERSTGIRGYVDEFRQAWDIFDNSGSHSTAQDQIAKMKRAREDLNAEVAKMTEEKNKELAKKMEADANKKSILDALGPVTIENAVEKFKKVTDLAKTVMGKNFDISDKMKLIQDKISGVDFSLFKDKSKEDEINQTLSTLGSVKALMGTITDIGILSDKAGKSLTSATSLKTNVEGFTKIVADLSSVINSGLKSHTEELATSIDDISKNAAKISVLGEIFKSLTDINATVSKMANTGLTNIQKSLALDSILNIENIINSIDGMPVPDQSKMNGMSGILDFLKGTLAQFNNLPTAFKGIVASMSGLGKQMSAAIDSVTGVQKKFDSTTISVESIESFGKNVKDAAMAFASEQMKSLGATNAVANITAVKQQLDMIAGLGSSYTEMSSSVMKATKDIGKNGIAPAMAAITKMVEVANSLDAALADGNLNKIDIKTKLENVAGSLGLGSKARYSVDNGKGVQITVNMTVTMNAGDVEKAIIYNKQSIIADRINFATSRPTETATDSISPNVEAVYPVAPRSR